MIFANLAAISESFSGNFCPANSINCLLNGLIGTFSNLGQIKYKIVPSDSVSERDNTTVDLDNTRVLIYRHQ